MVNRNAAGDRKQPALFLEAFEFRDLIQKVSPSAIFKS